MLTACLVVLLAAQSSAPARAESSDVAELTRLEQVWNHAHETGDAQALERLWAEDLVVVVPRMKVFTRADAVAVARSGRMRFERYQSSDLHVRVYGDAAVVTGRLGRRRTVGDTVVTDDWQFTKVYVRSGGIWSVVAFHASEAPQ